METYRIGPFIFIGDEYGSVDVSYGDTHVRNFQIRPGANRAEFIAECEDYFAAKMVFA